MEQVPLVTTPMPVAGGQRRKLMMEYKPKCLWHCYHTEVKVDGWEGQEVLKIERTLMDCLLVPCCGNRVTVSGAINGKIHSSFYMGKFSSSFINNDQGGAVSSMSLNALTNPVFWTLNMAYASCCSQWNIFTQPANVDFYVANGIDGSEAMGIHSDHEYKAMKGCCVSPNKSCWCLPFLCPASDYKTTVVRGPRLAGSQVVGSLASGGDGSCFCPHYGGVADIPANASPEEMVQWTMLWGETISWNGLARHKGNWKNQIKIKQVQQMQ
eukprot:TRINITY_DN341_c0_g1_i1.p1 TRINITY_DN341_c0_g1~~TRINITY_DN341_c0_g1_i1.p1  ORF type:complete len:268 (+),score=61.63 TRINITY_DN341_c0_g1_i1:65-868(+)